MVITDAEPNRGRRGWGGIKGEGGGGNDRLREGENFSLRELQYRDSKGILIIMRTKILGEKEVDELRDLGVLKLGREAD